MNHAIRWMGIVGGVIGVLGCESEGVPPPSEPREICGNRVKDAGEVCDDGNQVGGDGCSARCLLSGTLIECVPVVEGSALDDARALLPLADRQFMVGGQRLAGAVPSGWLGRFEGRGEPLWFQTLVPTGVHGSVDGLVTDGHEGCWALVHDGASPRLMHFDASGNVGSTVDIAATLGLPVVVHALEYGDTSIWLGGESGGDAWLGRYDPTTESIITLLLEDHLGFADSIRALGRSPTQIAFTATFSTSPNFEAGGEPVTATTEIVLGRFDLQGHELGRITYDDNPESGLARIADEVLFMAPDRWFVGGDHLPITAGASAQFWLARVQPAPTWAWTSYSVLTEQAGAVFGAMVVADDGELIVAGGVYRDPGNAAIMDDWLAAFGSDGATHWRSAASTAGYDQNQHQQIAVDSDGRLRVVGKARKQGASSIESCIVIR